MMLTTTVIRYVATYVNRAGQRTLMSPAQGRYTYATATEAQAWLDALRAQHPPSLITGLWGEQPRCEVRAVACYPGHFDPTTIYFDEGDTP